jgi:6-phosphogluconolactonase
MRTTVYVSCADDKQIVVLDMDRATGALREVSRTDVPGTAEPSPSSLPLALSPNRRWLYAALRTEPFPVCSFAIDPTTGALELRGTARLADSVCYLSTDGTGTRLFSASYGGAKLGLAPIIDGIAGETIQVLATPPKAHSIRPDPENRFVYAACLGGDVVLAQPFDGANLDPTPRPAARTRAGAGPRHFVFADRGRRLYLLNELDGTINLYDRDLETGALREKQSITALAGPAAGNVAAADIHLTPDERFLYASERTAHILAAFRVDAETGILKLIGHAPSEPTPRGFAIDPEGKFLLCAGLTSGRIAAYAIDQTSGALSRVSAVELGGGPNWIEIVPEE